MKEVPLKKYLIHIADKLTPESTLEDVYEHLSLLTDIDESEQQEKNGEVLTQKDVQAISREWFR
jgi:hypothetical protein